jgi:hypothetical protein
MTANSNNAVDKMTGDELFFGYVAQYLDGELPANFRESFEKNLTGREKILESFQVGRGKFQSSLGDIGGSEALKHKLRNFAQDDQIRETIEASEIAEVERSEMWSNILRRSVLSALLLALVGGAIYFFMPRNAAKFDVIEYIGYEAIALEEDPEGRTNLPSSDLEEIKQFVSTVPGLNYRPAILRPLKGWNPEGVSIIDYDVMKVIAVNYVSPERGQEHLHHFMIGGSMSDIPFKGEEADYRGIRYRVYSSDKLNILVWQQTPDMIAALAGHRSSPELAELARIGTPE